MVTLTTSAAF